MIAILSIPWKVLSQWYISMCNLDTVESDCQSVLCCQAVHGNGLHLFFKSGNPASKLSLWSLHYFRSRRSRIERNLRSWSFVVSGSTMQDVQYIEKHLLYFSLTLSSLCVADSRLHILADGQLGNKSNTTSSHECSFFSFLILQHARHSFAKSSETGPCVRDMAKSAVFLLAKSFT